MRRTATVSDSGDAPRLSSDHVVQFLASRDDVDELGHVSNIAILRWVLEAAKAHSRAVGWDYSAYVRLGAVFVVRRHEIDYLHPAYAGDPIRITTWVESARGASSLRRTQVVREDGTALARAATLWALVSTSDGRPRRIPRELMESFRSAP